MDAGSLARFIGFVTFNVAAYGFAIKLAEAPTPHARGIAGGCLVSSILWALHFSGVGR